MNISPASHAYTFGCECNNIETNEPKKQVSLSKKVATVGIAIPASFAASEYGVNKLMNSCKGLAERIFNDFGKTMPTLKKTTIASAKWLTILAATVLASTIALKDSDKNGEIDLLEAAGKFFGV